MRRVRATRSTHAFRSTTPILRSLCCAAQSKSRGQVGLSMRRTLYSPGIEADSHTLRKLVIAASAPACGIWLRAHDCAWRVAAQSHSRQEIAMFRIPVSFCLAASLALLPSIAFGEILAMVNYETKSPESLKALKSPVAAPARKEGIAIIDVDPKSKAFRQDRAGHPAAGRPRRAPHLLQPRPVQGLRHRARQGGAARHRHEEAAVRHQQSRGGAGLQRRRGRRLLRRRQALVPELHGHAGHGRRRRERRTSR